MSKTELPSAVQSANRIVVPAGQTVFVQGQSAENYLVVRSGCIKVFARSLEGREVVLYRVRVDEMCTLTTACLLGHTSYPAEAISETEVVASLIPSKEFDRLLNDSETFRHFVFTSFGRRLAEIIQRFEEMVLESIHGRLAHFLVENANGEGMVEITHGKLAEEIGTAREVISRHLKTMETAELINTQRGKITILQPLELANLIEV